MRLKIELNPRFDINIYNDELLNCFSFKIGRTDYWRFFAPKIPLRVSVATTGL